MYDIVVQGLEEVRQAFFRLLSADYSGYAREIKKSYIEQVFAVDAVDTGRFVQSIDWRPVSLSGDEKEFVIDTSKDVFVTYDGFIETGTKWMAARYPARRGIEAANIEQQTDFLINGVFRQGSL